MRFGLFTCSFIFDRGGLVIVKNDETKVNVELKSNNAFNNSILTIPIVYSREDKLNFKNGIDLSINLEAHYMRTIDWGTIFPQLKNLIVFNSLNTQDKYYIQGDYSEGKLKLRVLMEVVKCKLNIFILENDALVNVFNSCEDHRDIRIESADHKIFKRNPNSISMDLKYLQKLLAS